METLEFYRERKAILDGDVARLDTYMASPEANKHSPSMNRLLNIMRGQMLEYSAVLGLIIAELVQAAENA